MAAGAVAALSLSPLAAPDTTIASAAGPIPLAGQVAPAVDIDTLRAERPAASRGAARATEAGRRAAARPIAKAAERKTRPVVKRSIRPTRKASMKSAAKRKAHKAGTRRAAAGRFGRASGRAATVIAYARRQLGKPYSFGRLDCSGLTMRSFARVGVSLPHKASRQDERGYRVSRSAARPGDLVFWGGDNAYHVGIYVGRGRVIHAPKPGDRVKVSSLWGSYYFVRVLR